MSCVVEGCTTHSSRKANQNESLSFHRFPNDERMKIKWSQCINRSNWTPTKHSRICSKHFNEHSFVPNDNIKWRRLKSDAVPTLNIPETSSFIVMGVCSVALTYIILPRCEDMHKGDQLSGQLLAVWAYITVTTSALFLVVTIIFLIGLLLKKSCLIDMFVVFIFVNAVIHIVYFILGVIRVHSRKFDCENFFPKEAQEFAGNLVLFEYYSGLISSVFTLLFSTYYAAVVNSYAQEMDVPMN